MSPRDSLFRCRSNTALDQGWVDTESSTLVKSYGMQRHVATALLLLPFLVSCATSPTGRRQLQLIPDAQMNQLGNTSFAQMQQEMPTLKGGPVVDYVQCISDAIVRAKGDDPKSWTVRVFDQADVNAFALPGNNIGVYVGLVRVAENASQLAAVVGHEVGHVVAKHGEERMSQAMVAQTGLSVANALLGEGESKNVAMGALGLGAQFGVLMPFSRAHETEADRIGLDYMADAGFDPQQAVELWRNMAKASGGQAPPEFMSTHPSNETRIRDLQAAQNEVTRSAKRPNCKRPTL